MSFTDLYGIKTFEILLKFRNFFSVNEVFQKAKSALKNIDSSQCVDFIKTRLQQIRDEKTGARFYAYLDGFVPDDLRALIISIFNEKENKMNKNIQVILTGPVAKEGISLFRVQKAYLVNISWNFSNLKQILGRTVRLCSHKDVP
jgi:superfamily II DNA or RNA helicase